MLVVWLAQTHQQQLCRETVRRALRRSGLTYKKATKVLTRACPQKVHQLGWTLEALPGYSPDFMPVEELWRWFRQEVTGNYVHQNEQELLTRAAEFERSINEKPYMIADRLVVLECSDPELEELRFSM